MKNETSLRKLIADSLENVKKMVDGDTVVGKPFTTPSGVSVVTISKISVGIATGGLDLPLTEAKGNKKNYGGAGGTGITITPVCFLIIQPCGKADILPINQILVPEVEENSKMDDLLDKAPELLNQLQYILNGALTESMNREQEKAKDYKPVSADKFSKKARKEKEDLIRAKSKGLKK